MMPGLEGDFDRLDRMAKGEEPADREFLERLAGNLVEMRDGITATMGMPDGALEPINRMIKDRLDTCRWVLEGPDE